MTPEGKAIIRKIAGLLVSLVIASSSSIVPASVLTYEEVTIPETGVHYFSEIGEFRYEDRFIGIGTPLPPRGGIRLLNMTNRFSYLAETLPNVVSLSFEFQVSHFLISGGKFDFIGAFFGVNDIAADVFLDGYADGVLVYSRTITSPRIEPNGGTPVFFDFDWTGIDRLDVLSDRFTEGFSVMDNFTYRIAAIPEPTVLALMSLGLVGLGFSRHKKD